MTFSATEDLRGAALHFDCYAGIAGDMTVGALVDLGVPEEVVLRALAALPVGGYRVKFERVKRGALMGTKFRVILDEKPELHPASAKPHGHAHSPTRAHHHEHEHHHEHHHAPHDQSVPGDEIVGHHHGEHAHRHYADIRAMLLHASIGEGVRRRALAIFDRIAVVEAKLHGVSVAEVAFHEVGAIDSIVDIVGAAAALDWLSPSVVTSRIVPLGHGTVHTAHGLLPVPAPATLALLSGIPVEDGGVAMELTTPTGAAVLAATADSFGVMPPLLIIGTGWGAGDRELPDRPNLLRVIAGHPAASATQGRQVGHAASEDGAGERCLVVEANIDDTSPELVAPLLADLLDAGARDAWLTPVLMKKGRPGFVVSALVDVERVALVEAAFFSGSSTIGVRRHQVERTVLARRIVEVATPWGPVAVKVSGSGVESENAAPELEACRTVARAHGVPLKRVYAEALAAYFRR